MSAAEDPVDIFVVGGGVNGCGIARDAAGRGYSVRLAEMNDLASGTSSWSTKLVHGGLRYLEHYEFMLVRKALKEREVLWADAPHLIHPMRFVLPHHAGLRPAWLLRLGLFLYDHLGGRKRLPATRTLDLRKDPAGRPLKPEFTKGFEYSDCTVDDARLVVLNALDAAERGARIETHTRVVSLARERGLWRITLSHPDDRRETLTARLVVNAAGPWVDRVLAEAVRENNLHNVRLVQGSHIVVEKLYDHDRSYIFQNSDGRIVFAIPYQDRYTLIGTTDRDYAGDPGEAAISDEEIDYLCALASDYFAKPVTRDQVVWSFSGVRPLYDDGATAAQEATRDYVMKVDGDAKTGALINIFGGKITTYRRLAETVMEMIEGLLEPKGAPWTGAAALPGGDFPVDGLPALVDGLRARYPFLDPAQALRLGRLFGTRAQGVLGGAKAAGDLGRVFGRDLTEREVRYMMRTEWARTAEDILWRRTKLGLEFTPEQASELDRAMNELRIELAV